MPELSDSVFWIELEKISPNPYQPRREFDEEALKALADSIRQYGVLQPLVVTRKEHQRDDGGLAVSYELIAGERRLRASKLAGLEAVPAVIRTGEQTDSMKLELAIIENLQREDLNVVDRAEAFSKLSKEFGYKHSEIAKKIGRSREYVSNTIRVLNLPENMRQALKEGKLSEGHARPLLMLSDKSDEQETMFKDILLKKLSVRETERMSRRIAVDRVRKPEIDTELMDMERKLTENLGTQVYIEKKDKGGKILISFFSPEDLSMILSKLEQNERSVVSAVPSDEEEIAREDVPPQEEKENQEDPDLYSVSNFSL